MFRAAEGLRKRSLQLAFCGLPSKPFKGLSPGEEALVSAAYEETKEKLKNPNVFVNKKRKTQQRPSIDGLGFRV